MKPKKVYYPAENPLPKSVWVPAHVDPKTGRWVQGYWRRPKYRHGVIVGYY
jgi:hypothetical protein